MIKHFTNLAFLVYFLASATHNTEAVFRKNLFPSPVSIDGQSGDYGEPLFLTPLIESGQLELARQKSLVKNLPNAPDLESYAGYLTVNKKFDSNMFFWFFPNQNPNAPVLLWLQGGPGGSSMFGLFIENGPIVLDKDLLVHLRKYSWANDFSMIYIDNPVGTGFSFTREEDGYARNETHVAKDLYNALQQFFTLFNTQRNNDFYVTGESYAGKYVPAIAYKIHQEGSASNIRLKGIAIGDGLCDPETMFNYADFLFQTGLMDENQASYFRSQQEKAVQFIKQENYLDAFKIFDALLNGDLLGTPSYFTNVTGLTFYYNYLLTSQPEAFNYYSYYFAKPELRKAINVGNLTFNDGSIVEKHLLEDVMKSIKPWISVLMDNYKVLIYSGQLDVIIAAPLTESFVRSINWSGSDDYLRAERKIWKVNQADKEVAGYVRKVKDFYQVVVRNAGHILPYDQPRVGLDMITRFVNDQF